MSTQMMLDNVFKKSNGIARTADFNAYGISTQEVAKLCKEGRLLRIKHGYYQRADDLYLPDEQILASLLPEAVICLESVLFHYGYSDLTPRAWSVMVPRNISLSKLEIDGLVLDVHFVSKNLYDIGKTTEDFNGVQLAVYDRERTICDCFKFRSQLDSEVFNKALNAYAKDEQKNLANLIIYAKKLRVYKKVEEIMEVLLNG